MITPIFPNYFYLLIPAPNKEELLKTIQHSKVDKKQTEMMQWAKRCKIEVEALHPSDLAGVIAESLNIFLTEMGIKDDNRFSKIQLISAWRNTYRKDSYQEIHDHLGGGEMSDLSGCIFLNDHCKDSSMFYFYNRHSSEISPSWRDAMTAINLPHESYSIEPKAGDVLLFPSYMMHGVTLHKINQPRRTVSFNVRFNSCFDSLVKSDYFSQ